MRRALLSGLVAAIGLAFGGSLVVAGPFATRQTSGSATANVSGATGTLAVANGGTGSTTAAAALSALGAAALAGSTFTGAVVHNGNATFTATGTGVDNSDAAAIGTYDEIVITAGAASTGAVLPAATVGRRIKITNKSGSAKKIWPATGQNAGQGTNTAIGISNNEQIDLQYATSTSWNTEIPSNYVNGTSFLEGPVTISSGAAGGLGTGNLAAQGTLNITGAATLSSTLAVTGSASAAGLTSTAGLTVSGGNANFASTTVPQASFTPNKVDDAGTAHVGGGHASCTLITTAAHFTMRLTAVASAGDSYCLPAPSGNTGWMLLLSNETATSTQLFAGQGGSATINNVATDTGVALAGNKSTICVVTTSTNWACAGL